MLNPSLQGRYGTMKKTLTRFALVLLVLLLVVFPTAAADIGAPLPLEEQVKVNTADIAVLKAEMAALRLKLGIPSAAPASPMPVAPPTAYLPVSSFPVSPFFNATGQTQASFGYPMAYSAPTVTYSTVGMGSFPSSAGISTGADQGGMVCGPNGCFPAQATGGPVRRFLSRFQ